MSIFDAITHAVKEVAEVAIETAVPILPHDPESASARDYGYWDNIKRIDK